MLRSTSNLGMENTFLTSLQPGTWLQSISPGGLYDIIDHVPTIITKKPKDVKGWFLNSYVNTSFYFLYLQLKLFIFLHIFYHANPACAQTVYCIWYIAHYKLLFFNWVKGGGVILFAGRWGCFGYMVHFQLLTNKNWITFKF